MLDKKIEGAEIRLEEIKLPFSKEREILISLLLEKGEVCEIRSPFSERMRLFFRILVTLQEASSGQYYFNGKLIDFSKYQELLSIKAKIAYISSEASLITNRNIQENILMGRAWQKNSLNISMEPHIEKLCQSLDLEKSFNLRPANIGYMSQRAVIAMRELAKDPELIIVERPEDFVGKNNRDVFIKALKDYNKRGSSLIFWTDDNKLGENWSSKSYTLDEQGFYKLT